jgi:hypothetical protein
MLSSSGYAKEILKNGTKQLNLSPDDLVAEFSAILEKMEKNRATLKAMLAVYGCPLDKPQKARKEKKK